MRDPTTGLDKVITDAQQEGNFEDLPGKGKPLVIDTSPDAVIKGILKEANVSVAPEWVRLACEIDRLIEDEEKLLRSYAATYEAGRTALAGGDTLPAATEPTAPPGAARRWWQV